MEDIVKVYERTENGTTTTVTIREGLDEINHAMTDGANKVATMSQINRTDYAIGYEDGRSVRLIVVEEHQEPELEKGPKAWTGKTTVIVTVKGKRYIVEDTPGQGHFGGYVHYWSERNGKTWGATRSANESNKPNTISGLIWAQVSK